MTAKTPDVNLVGLTKNDYKGARSTLCPGCGHNSIANQVIAACYELNIVPENIAKYSGIGCSSKSPTYFLNRTFGFNGLHGRMPAVATGAAFADFSIRGLGFSGDGDSASIGMGQFKHIMRRNAPLVYIVENNGVYGLTKGQFSATSEAGLTLKNQGTNSYMPVDIVLEALSSDATFVARSFAGDAKQVKALIKAALHHDGIAILDIISPCVSFNNSDDARYSFSWGKSHNRPIHNFSFIPHEEEITVSDFEKGSTRNITMYDGSTIILQKLEEDYDPTDRHAAMNMVMEANKKDTLITGLIYVDMNRPNLKELYSLPDQALNRLPAEKIRPSRESLDELNKLMI